uniref:Uncharacterized protein n=1 Tax=Arundo donax TaxID=35708 RepID=A0A0A9GVB0_ARUDO
MLICPFSSSTRFSQSHDLSNGLTSEVTIQCFEGYRISTDNIIHHTSKDPNHGILPSLPRAILPWRFSLPLQVLPSSWPRCGVSSPSSSSLSSFTLFSLLPSSPGMHADSPVTIIFSNIKTKSSRFFGGP